MKRPLTPEELDAIMTPGKYVHTFVQGGGSILVGADWKRSELLALARTHGAELAGETATAMKHGAAVYDGGKRAVFIATDETALAKIKQP